MAGQPPRECPHVASCALYPHFRLGSSLFIWQQRFCLGAFGDCERYKLSSAGQPVPALLLPNGEMLRKLK